MARQLTITLDDDVAQRLEETRRAGTAVDDVVNEAANEAVRRVLHDLAPATPRRFVVRARDLGARPDVNFDCAWKLIDEIDGPAAK